MPSQKIKKIKNKWGLAGGTYVNIDNGFSAAKYISENRRAGLGTYWLLGEG